MKYFIIFIIAFVIFTAQAIWAIWQSEREQKQMDRLHLLFFSYRNYKYGKKFTLRLLLVNITYYTIPTYACNFWFDGKEWNLENKKLVFEGGLLGFLFWYYRRLKHNFKMYRILKNDPMKQSFFSKLRDKAGVLI